MSVFTAETVRSPLPSGESRRERHAVVAATPNSRRDGVAGGTTTVMTADREAPTMALADLLVPGVLAAAGIALFALGDPTVRDDR